MKWYYLEKIPHYIETLPSGFRENKIPLTLPKWNLTPSGLAEHFKRSQPDIVLTSGWTPFLREPYFKVVRQYCQDKNRLHIYWSTEDPIHTETWGTYVMEVGKPDLVFTHALNAPMMYRQMGIPTYYLPFACNPKIHRTIPLRPKLQSDIALVANFSMVTMESWRIHSLRILLEPLLKEGRSVTIWGKGWKEEKKQLPFRIPDESIRGPLNYHHVAYVYASSKIILGIQNHQQLLTRRTWESLGTGGFLLTNHTSAILRHFTPGVHLVTSKSPEETRTLVNQYLKMESRRRTIAKQGQREVHQHHTYAHRVREMKKIASEVLETKRKGKTSFLLPSLLKREIRPVQAVTFPQTPRVQGSYLKVERTESSDCKVFLWFPLHEEGHPNLDVDSAELKLFVANRPKGNLRLQCAPILSSRNRESVQTPRISKESSQEVPIPGPRQ